MSDNSAIEWTDATWNPVRGCTKISPGCKHCYAETFAERFRGVPRHPYEQGFDLRLVPEKIGDPLRWRKPRTIFVNSMSDLFQEGVPNEYVAACFGVMASTPQHTHQVLTKRAAAMRRWAEWVAARGEDGLRMFPDDETAWRIWQMLYVAARKAGADVPPHHGGAWPLSNVWLGVSVEDRKFGLPRIEHLRRTPAAVRFLSIEPLLEDLGEIDLSGIGWVIVGGESGLGARRMCVEWVSSIRDQCVDARVPFFFKQWGGLRKKVAGRLLDGRTWDEMPAREVPRG